MNPILGAALVFGITGLAVWAVWKWWGLPAVSPDGESSDPGWWDPLPDGVWCDGCD